MRIGGLRALNGENDDMNPPPSEDSSEERISDGDACVRFRDGPARI
jgi:hypothetical protein